MVCGKFYLQECGEVKMNRQWMDKQIHSFSQPRQHDAWEEMPCDSLKPTNAIPKEEEKEE